MSQGHWEDLRLHVEALDRRAKASEEANQTLSQRQVRDGDGDAGQGFSEALTSHLFQEGVRPLYQPGIGTGKEQMSAAPASSSTSGQV